MAALLLINCPLKYLPQIISISVFTSSFTGFITYASMGHVNIKALTIVGIIAFIGGYYGNKIMRQKLNQRFILIGLNTLTFLLGAKVIWDALA